LAGPAAVAHLRWDVLARQQEEVYLAALRPVGGRHRAAAGQPAAPAGSAAGAGPVPVQSTVVSGGGAG
jgi:hypothetical protein